MRTKLMIGLSVLILTGLVAGCSKNNNANANATATENPAGMNANTTTAENPTLTQTTPTGPDPTQSMTPQPAPPRPAADNSEIQTRMDEKGDVIETRTFKNNKNVSKVVVTTHGTKRTAKVYNSKGEAKELPEAKVKDALTETGDALAAAVGFVVDKSKDAAGKTKEGAETVMDKTADGTRAVADRTVEGAKKVGEKTAEGAKKGAKKVKDAIVP